MPTTLNWQGWHEWAVQVCDGVLNSVVGRAHRLEHCAKICRPFRFTQQASSLATDLPAAAALGSECTCAHALEGQRKML